MTWQQFRTADGERIVEHKLIMRGKPVSSKNRRPIHRNRATGKPFVGKSVELRQWFTRAIRELRLAWRAHDKLKGDLHIAIEIYQGRGQSIDADNVINGAFDALQKAGVVGNDYQFSQGSWARGRDRDDPRVEVTLTPAH